VSITRVRSRYVVTTAGAILVLLGLVPKLGDVVASLPGPVIGGAGLVMFATVTAVGIRTLARVEYDGNANLLLVAVALGVAMLPVAAPDIYTKLPDWAQIVVRSAITSTVVTAFCLNLLFNHLPWARGTDAAPPGGEAMVQGTSAVSSAAANVGAGSPGGSGH
jgi:uric acid transporter